MIAIGKGIGNGYPVSVAVLNSVTAKELRKTKSFSYLQSHQNDPLGAAVAQAVLREIESNNLITEAQRKGPLFLDQLNSLVDRKTVLGVRGRGMMFAIDMANTDVVNMIYTDMINMGYILGNRGTALRIDPPLVITEAEFDRFLKVFKTVIGCKKNMASQSPPDLGVRF
jgi:acetylornithine aminotransferase